MSLKIAMGQLLVESGHPSVNVQKMKDMIMQAKNDGADIIVFPQMCVGGYFLGDKWFASEFRNDLLTYNEDISSCSDGIGVVWGNIFEQDGLVYDAGYYAYQQEIKYIQPKQCLQQEGIFNDGRYLKTQASNCAFVYEKEGKQHIVGIVIGDDLYSDTVMDRLIACDVILHMESKPWTLDDENKKDERVKTLLPTVYSVNCVGMQNTGKNIAMFDGKSCVYEKGIRVCTLRDDFKEEYAVCDYFDHSKKNKLLNCLVTAIKEFDRQVMGYNPKWIIGLSGGLDSSVTVALLSMALGSDRVCGYNLATKYNSQKTKDNAQNEADALGVKIRNGYISDIYEATVNTMKVYGYQDEDMPTLVHENIQARTRGNVLSTFSQIENGVIMNNGNKIEVALGYATLYGDSIGAMSPLGDLTKVQLFELSRQINAHFDKEIIPERLLPTVTEDGLDWEMAPSAELKDNQYDPMKWFYHDWLISQLTDTKVNVEDIMESYLDGSLLESNMGRWLRYYHLDKPEAFIQDLEWVLRQMRIAIFKRIQMPPIVMVTNSAYGSNKCEIQGTFENTRRYQKLRQDILNMK